MLQKPTSKPTQEDIAGDAPKDGKKERSNWNVIIFMLPSLGNRAPKSPNGKNWLDVLLLLLKVAAAGIALWKAAATVVY